MARRSLGSQSKLLSKAFQHIEDGYYLDALEELSTYALAPNLTDPDPRIQAHKTELIAMLLELMKDSNGGNELFVDSNNRPLIPHAILALRKLGANWPELDIILRSYQSFELPPNSLDESSAGMNGDQFLNMISQGLIEQAVSQLDHHNYKYGDDPSIDRVFDQKINLVQKWMERMLDISIADGSYAWRMIKNLELPWDSVDSWWADHKAETVRRLLKLLKEDRYEDVLGIIDDILDDLGLAWPELDVIRRTAQAELDRISTRDDLDEDDNDDDEGPIWRRVTPEEGIVDHMYRRMREGSVLALHYAIADLEERRMPDHMIEEMLRPQAGSIVRWIDSKIKEGLYRSTVDQMWKLLEIGARWPSLAQLFNKHKAMLVRNMLTQIKAADSMDLEDLEGHLRQLSELGIDWPELDIISHSVNAELDRIHSIDESGDMLGYRISKGDLIDGMQDSLRAGHNGAWANNYAHMRPFWKPDFTVKKLTGIKPDIVAWVNNYLSSDNDSNWRYGKQAVIDLDDLGVDWPELWLTVDRHRGAWLRRWLTQLKELLGGGHREELEDLESNLRYWRDLFAKHGLKWPEIDTILASIYAHGDARNQLTEGEDLRKYVDWNGELYQIEIPVDQDWQTSGKVAKPVRVTKIAQFIEADEDGYISDMSVYFDTDTWDLDTDGWIYDDPLFFKQLQQFLRGLGVPRDIVSQISYGDQSAQDYDLVSFDALAFGEYVADQFIIGDADTMDQRKTEIIRAILLVVKDGYFNRAAAILNKLKELGADWPELKSIEKSLRAGKQLGEANIEDPVIKQIRKLLGDAQLHVALDLIRRHAIQVSKHPELIKLLWDNKDAIIRAVKYNLRAKSYGAAYDKIADLLQTGINWPWLREMADAVPKEDVIRHMLMTMKQDNMFGMEDVAYTVRNAKRLGYDWPELDIIHKSLNSRKPVTESALTRATVEEAKQMLWRELPGGNWWILGRALDRMIYAMVPHSEIFAVLDEYKQDILAQQIDLTQGEGAEVLAGVSNLRRLREIGAGWPEIDQLLAQNKRHIMRAALTEIKHYSTEDYGDELPHIYKNLKQLKVAWPEMAVIEDGIDTIQQLGEDQIPNAEKSMVIAELTADVDMIKRISVRLDYYKELLDKLDALRKSGHDWPELRQFEKTIRRQMKQRYNKIQQELPSVDPQAVTHAYFDVEDLLGKAAAKDWLYDNRQAIAHALDRNLAHDGYIRATDILLKNLAGWGAKWPEILSVFAKNKEHLIRDMLVDIKQRNADPNDITHLQDRVALFKKFVPDWPELDIINKSINAQKISEDWHDVDTDDYDEVYGRVGQYLGDIEDGLRPSMSEWHAEIVVNGLAGLAQLLDNHDWLSTPTPSEYSLDLVKQKPLFIKALLIGMKHSDFESVDYALRMLEDYWHVLWPELDIMHKSMQAGKVTEASHDDDDDDKIIPKTNEEEMAELAGYISYILRRNQGHYGAATVVGHLSNIGSRLDHHPELSAPPLDTDIDLNDHKDDILRVILQGMTKYAWFTYKWAIVALKKYGITWPELDIMQKSMQAGKMNESVPSYDEEAYRYAEDTAARLCTVAGDPISAMYVFLELADHPELVGPWAAECFQPHRGTWIRWLLVQLKGDEVNSFESFDSDEIYEAVSMLKRMQLPWPELKVIARSIQGDFRG